MRGRAVPRPPAWCRWCFWCLGSGAGSEGRRSAGPRVLKAQLRSAEAGRWRGRSEPLRLPAHPGTGFHCPGCGAMAGQPGTGICRVLAVMARKHRSWTERAKNDAPYSSSHRLGHLVRAVLPGRRGKHAARPGQHAGVHRVLEHEPVRGHVTEHLPEHELGHRGQVRLRHGRPDQAVPQCAHLVTAPSLAAEPNAG